MNLMILLFAAAAAPEWMAGCWSGQAGPMTFEETWTRAASGNMMGIARTLKSGRVVFSEFMRIEAKDGIVVYTPRIGSKQAPVDFRLKSLSDTEVVFENPAHDFPQLILYRRTAEGLQARIEGIDKGKQRAEDFRMKRVTCP
jgi:hypothetical protein